MFEIDAQNLPVVRTRQALLVLDLQNDFVSPGAILAVDNPPDFVEKILKLVPEFRKSGRIIWIRTEFETSRAINEAERRSESVMTDRELPRRSRGGALLNSTGLSRKILEAFDKVAETTIDADGRGDLVVEETYLTMGEGEQPCVALPDTHGANFSQDVSRYVDENRDTVFVKSTYSAFEDGKLVQMLRARFVTRIYICGALTNISVFATAMDAAQHGYEITIIDDCLGYRSQVRHDEALRKLVESTGCDIINSRDLVEELKWKAQKQASARNTQRHPPGQRYADIESLMASLNLNMRADEATVLHEVTGSPIVAAHGPLASLKDEDESPNLPPKYILSQSHDLSQSPSLAQSPRLAQSPSLSQSPNLPQSPKEPLNLSLPQPDNLPQSEKKERVKARYKKRRRNSNPRPKDVATVSDKDNTHLPTATTFQAAHQALQKGTSSGESTSNSTPELAATPENMTLEPHAEEASQLPDQLSELEKATPVAPALTPLCEGDTTIITNLLDDDVVRDIFERLRDEVRWQKMSHQGGDVPRLVAVQGEIGDDGSIPIYRHPADESPPLLPFSANVSLIRSRVEKQLGHSVNHVLIQFYRDGMDHISEHSDKTLDIVPKTFIANVSLGAQRTMVFRTKKLPKTENVTDIAPRQSCRAALPHNSMCKMGLVTNMRWLHGIRQDKRSCSEKSDAELAFKGGRISLTFRSIGTYLDKDQQKIWGQGATSKKKEEGRTVINGDTVKAEQMIRAFGKENHSSEFDWNEWYGEGFDVLHLSNGSKLFLSGDFVADARVKLLLAEFEISWSEGKLSPSFNWKSDLLLIENASTPTSLPVRFVDSDLSKSTVTGDLAILLYLGAVHSWRWTDKSNLDLARQYTRLQQCEDVLKKWRSVPLEPESFGRELGIFEAYAGEAEFIAGPTASLADFALWPILFEVKRDWKQYGDLPNLVAYYGRMEARKCVRTVVPKEELRTENEVAQEVISTDSVEPQEKGQQESDEGLNK